MKTTYQQFNSYFLKCVRVVMKERGIDFETASARMIGLMEKPDPKNGVQAEMKAMSELISIGLQMRVVRPESPCVMKAEECIHLFVRDEAFLDWLVSCAPTLEDGSPEAMAEMAGGNVCVLHFPTKSKYRCLAFMFYPPCEENGHKASVFLCFSSGEGMNLNDPPLCIDYSERNHDPGTNGSMHARLLNALGLYLSCFPEMLRGGPPDDVKHPAHHQYLVSKTIGISPKVRVQTERGEVTAHFRKGHFRVLRSEHFIHKRWKAVFIKATFVKGEALTILSPEEA